MQPGYLYNEYGNAECRLLKTELLEIAGIALHIELHVPVTSFKLAEHDSAFEQ
ncbi:hypothetical protein D3C85_1583530 [compost metagenome]